MTKRSSFLHQIGHQAIPVLVILLFVLVAWYGAAVGMNAAGAIERVLPADLPWTWQAAGQHHHGHAAPGAAHTTSGGAAISGTVWWTGRWTHRATCCFMWP
jgi:hypothetical protein